MPRPETKKELDEFVADLRAVLGDDELLELAIDAGNSTMLGFHRRVMATKGLCIGSPMHSRDLQLSLNRAFGLENES